MATSPVTPPPGYTVESAPLSNQQTSLPEGYSIEQQSSSGQTPEQQPAPGSTPVEQLYSQEDQAIKGFGKGLEDTTAGVGSLIRKGLSMVSPSLAEKVIPAQGLSTERDQAVPHGAYEKLGYGGEGLAEFLLGDEALKGLSLADKLKHVSSVAKIFESSPTLMKAVQTGANISKMVGALGPEEASALQKSPILARLASAGMDAIRHGVVQGVQTGVKTGGDVKEAAKEGAVQAGASAVLGGAGGLVGGLADKAVPEANKIAGVEVPTTPLNADNPSLAAKALKPLATNEGAAKAIAEQTQPQAVKATVANLDQSALDKINDLRGARGETPAAFDPKKVQSVGDISKNLQKEAQTTYKKFDAVSDQLDEQYKDARKTWEQLSPEEQKTTPPPEKPERFSDMQSEIQKARKTLSSNAPNDAKEAAINKLDEYNQKIEDFADKHSEAAGISDQERRAANKTYQTSVRYDWIHNKLQGSFMNKAGATGDTISNSVKVNPTTLKSMPGQFDKKFGEGAFRTMVGEDGWDNYNKVIKALQNPIVRSKQGEILNKVLQSTVGAGLGTVAGGPVGGAMGAAVASKAPNMIADRILFDPKFGSNFLKLAEKAIKVGNNPIVKQQTGQALMGKSTLGSVLSGAEQPLSSEEQ